MEEILQQLFEYQGIMWFLIRASTDIEHPIQQNQQFTFKMLYILIGEKDFTAYRHIPCRMTKILRLLRLLKLSKTGRNFHFSHFLSAIRYYSYVPFTCGASVFFVAIVLAHWIACMFHFVAYLDVDTSYTWLHASGMVNKGNAERYELSLNSTGNYPLYPG